MRLRDDAACKLFAPVVVMTLRATHIDLPAALSEQPAARLDKGRKPLVAWRRDRHAARLPADIGTERQQLTAFQCQRRGLLMLGAADVDALLEIDRAVAGRAERWVARCNPLHADRRILMAIRTRAVGGTGLLIPQRLAVKHP